jgi:RNA polymerase primary sigma factor
MKRLNDAKSGDWNALDAYLSDVQKHKVLTPEELSEITGLSSSGDLAAQERLIQSHLRLVVGIAHQYAGFGLPLADIISEGNLGLIRAAELYDPKYGTKFSTYASVWIKQRIHRAITKQAKSVRIPMWRSQRLRKIARISDELSGEFGRPASEDELASRLGLSTDEIEELRRDKLEVVSLDAPLRPGEDDSGTLMETFLDENAQDASETTSKHELIEEMITSLHDLDDRELQIVTAKFGFQQGGEVSFRELGRRYGVSHEWVRRISELAIVKVRRALEGARSLTRTERMRRKAQVLERLARLGATPATIAV